MTDIVITYVRPSDKEWMAQYQEECARLHRFVHPDSLRFREWDTLRYVLRGIDTHMPWVGNVYIVVERESQVPRWIDREAVRVITHDKIIPKEKLPTYNSATIELFLYKIPSLSEQFIYANDDMIPVGDLIEEDFFRDMIPCLEVEELPYSETSSLYRHHLYNGTELARRLVGLPTGSSFIRTGHNLHPMLRSTWEMLWNAEWDTLYLSATRFRKNYNINQDVAAHWQILSGAYVSYKRRSAYFEMNEMDDIEKSLRDDKDLQLICVNDAVVKDYRETNRRLTNALAERLPNPSIYEL